ncbi:hypothetical protein ACQP3D_28640, partial [Escherichia coli]
MSAVVHNFNPSILDLEAGTYLDIQATWSTKLVPGELQVLHRETMYVKSKKTNKKPHMIRDRIDSSIT